MATVWYWAERSPALDIYSATNISQLLLPHQTAASLLGSEMSLTWEDSRTSPLFWAWVRPHYQELQDRHRAAGGPKDSHAVLQPSTTANFRKWAQGWVHVRTEEAPALSWTEPQPRPPPEQQPPRIKRNTARVLSTLPRCPRCWYRAAAPKAAGGAFLNRK